MDSTRTGSLIGFDDKRKIIIGYSDKQDYSWILSQVVEYNSKLTSQNNKFIWILQQATLLDIIIYNEQDY